MCYLCDPPRRHSAAEGHRFKGLGDVSQQTKDVGNKPRGGDRRGARDSGVVPSGGEPSAAVEVCADVPTVVVSQREGSGTVGVEALANAPSDNGKTRKSLAPPGVCGFCDYRRSQSADAMKKKRGAE